MDLSMSAIMAGLIFGGIGFWMLREGKRKAEFQIILIAMALMIYPYFTHGPVQDWGIGFCLCGLAWYLWV